MDGPSRWAREAGPPTSATRRGGDPNLHLRLDLLPDGDLATMDVDDFRAVGMAITATPAVNAIPAVVAAPGIKTYADLPVVTSRMT